MLEQMLGTEKAQEFRPPCTTLARLRGIRDRVTFGEIWSRPGLDKRTKSVITIAALMAMGRRKGLELNIRMGTNNGVTQEEITETLLHLAPYAGFPAAGEALSIAHKVFSEVG